MVVSIDRFVLLRYAMWGFAIILAYMAASFVITYSAFSQTPCFRNYSTVANPILGQALMLHWSNLTGYAQAQCSAYEVIAKAYNAKIANSTSLFNRTIAVRNNP